MMEDRDGRRVFTGSPNPSAIYEIDDPMIGREEVDVGNIPIQPLLDVIDWYAVHFGSMDEVKEEEFKPSDLITITALALAPLNPNLSRERLGKGHPTVTLPFVRAILAEQIMPQVRAAFEAMNLKNG